MQLFSKYLSPYIIDTKLFRLPYQQFLMFNSYFMLRFSIIFSFLLLFLFSNSSFIAAQNPVKKTLIETYTSAFCGECPKMPIKIDSLLDIYPNLIWVEHHAGAIFNDSMCTPQSREIATKFGISTLQATIDRKPWNSLLKVNPVDWQAAIQQSITQNPEANILYRADYEPSQRVLDMNFTINFNVMLPAGEIRLNIMIVEDSVFNVGPGYDQYNDFNNVVNHPLYQAGQPITDYPHRYVVRSILDDTWGTAGVIHSQPLPFEVFVKNYRYTVPTMMDISKLYIIAFVSYYEPNNQKYQLFNAVKIPLKNIHFINNRAVSDALFLENLKIYPNPCQINQDVYLSYESNTNDDIYIELYDLLGKEIFFHKNKSIQGTNFHIIRNNSMKAGVYYLKVKQRDKIYAKKIIFN